MEQTAHPPTAYLVTLGVVGLVLYLIYRSLPLLVSLPLIVIILGAIFPSDRLLQGVVRAVNANLGLWIFIAIIWFVGQSFVRRRR